jgi:hypothetical protein
MSASNNNIKFNYLYRDAGNYKEFGEIIFTNCNSESLENIERLIRKNLIEGEFFIPEKWNIPRISLGDFSPGLDHDYHEFESLEITAENPTESIDISTFLIRISGCK